MKNDRRFACDPTLILLCATLLGCSAGVKATNVGTGGSAGGSVGSGGSGAAGHAGTTGSGGTGTSGTTGSGNSDGSTTGDGACAGEAVGAVAVPLDLYFVMDSSKSMLDNTGAGTSKWKAVGSALNTFFMDGGSAGLGVALKYFPDEQAGAPASCTMTSECGSFGNCDRRQTCVGSASTTTQVSPLCADATTCGSQSCALIQDCGGGNYCAAGPTAAAGACKMPGTSTACSTFPGYCHLRDICTSSQYATPDVPMMTLPAGLSTLMTSLSNHTPDGYTPTGPALKGAVTYAQARLASNPDHKVAVVLVTDGLPGGFLPGFPPPECMPSDVNMIASMILSPAATANPPILTFVVGIFNPSSLEGMAAPTNLAALATAGGTGTPVIIDVTQNDVTQKLQDALTQARTKAIACSYEIPQPSHGNLDFMKVNVQFTPGGAATANTIPKTTGPTACDKGGWYYDSDADPSIKTPTRIIACPSTCADFNKDTAGVVGISLNCMTIMVS